MIREPFYQAVVARLGARLDPEAFERCAADLLRTVYPGLVPVRGGRDGGMDGAIPDGEGTAFPLVSTTSVDALGNLRASLQSYLDEDGERRKAVFATSRELTPIRRRNLLRAASDLGFTLVQIYDQAAFADLLYRSPEWCRELLNLSGDPPALSALPLSSRPDLGNPLVGRDADLGWLSDATGDAVLIGQPGSGKTSLLRALVTRGLGLFAVSDDRGRIAEAIRAQAPEAIFVDDAHLQPGFLLRLAQLRKEMKAGFRIVATCWPGEAAELAKALGLSKSGTRELSLLDRKAISEVIRSCGIAGPPRLLRELIDQAKGRPGLAVTLCFLCRREGVREVVTGMGLYEDVRSSFAQIVGPAAVPILAAFAVGGDQGMPMEAVAQALGVSLLKVQQATVRLALGGVLTETYDHALAVEPEALRHALVGQVFFGGAGSLRIEPLLLTLRHPDGTALTLLGALGRGASVPHHLIRMVLLRCRDVRAWQAYASFGEHQTLWVLEARPDLFSSIASPALDTAPLRILPQLLTRAMGDDRPLNSTLDHPLRILQDWIKAAVPGEGDAVHRRKVLLNALLAWYAGGGADEVVCLRALSIVFTPAFEDTERDPVDLSGYTLRFGCLVADEVAALRSLWSRALPLLQSCGIAHWDALRELIHHWAYPGSGRGGPASPEVAEEMRDFARQLSEDVLAMAGEHQGVRQWVAGLASRMGWEIDVTVDREFEILFPEHPRGGRDLHESSRKQHEAAIALGDRWAQETPVAVAERFARYEQAAAFVGHRWPVFTEQIAERIAASFPDPFPWSDAILATTASHAVVGPFLRRALRDALPGSEELWEACYRQSLLRGMAILAAIKDQGTSPRILEKALSDLSGMADALGTEALRHQLPEHRLRVLLGHPDQSVAAEVAWGVWHADPEGSVPEGLRDPWRNAVITGDMEHSYTLRQIFESDPAIASGWLVNRIARGADGYWRWPDDDPLPSAIRSLDAGQRCALLDQLNTESTDMDLVGELVGHDAEVFRALLANPRLQAWHLSPLAGDPDGEWIPLALAALDAGYSAQEVAEAAYGIMPGWEGRESTFWHSWADRFRRLEEQDDMRLRDVGRIGREDAEASEALAAAMERDREVTGRRRC